MRAGGQARVLGKDKGEGTSGFVEPGTADPQILRATDPVRSPSATHPHFLVTRPAGQQRRESPTSGAAASGHGAPGEQSQRVAADRPKRRPVGQRRGNAPGRDRVLVTEDLAPPEKTVFANSSGRPPVPNRPLA